MKLASHHIFTRSKNISALKNNRDGGNLTMDVVNDIFPTREPRVHVPNVLPTHPTLHLDMDFILLSEPRLRIYSMDLSSFSHVSPVALHNLLVQWEWKIPFLTLAILLSFIMPGTGYSLKDKNEAKPDKTESGIEKSAKNRGQSPDEVKVNLGIWRWKRH
ncbi:hypothetical protein Tco_0737180 [Tanacetum coccineum]